MRIIVLGTIYIVAGLRNPKIILDNDEFQINRKLEGKTMWKCAQYNKTRCRSRLITFGKSLKITFPHNHKPAYPDSPRTNPQYVNIIRK